MMKVYFCSQMNPQNELRLYPNGYSGYGQVHPYQTFVDEFEMTEIQNNQDLNRSLKRALKDVKAQKGRFVE